MVGEVSLAALAVVIGMSVITYATKAGGFWALERINPSDSTREALDALPGGIIIAILVVRLVNGGPIEWVAGLLVIVVAHRTGNVLLAMVSGLGILLVIGNAIG